MDNFLDSYLTWFQFAMIAILVFCLYFVTNRYKSYFKFIAGLHNLNFVNAFYIIFVIICFILVNPKFHGLIALVALILFYGVLTSYFRGMIITSNSKIDKGDVVKIGEYKGKVASIDLAGVQLINDKNNLLVPYTMMANEAIEKFETGQSRYLYLICSPEGEAPKNAIQILEKATFNFPFLEYGSDIEIKQENDNFNVHLTLAHDQFQNSLFNQIKKAGFSIQINNSQ